MCSALDGVEPPTDVYYWSLVYRHLVRGCELTDPGIFAAIGCGAFLGGSGRITLFLAVVLLELTDDVKLLAPMGLTVIIAMYIGNRFNHGLCVVLHGAVHGGGTSSVALKHRACPPPDLPHAPLPPCQVPRANPRVPLPVPEPGGAHLLFVHPGLRGHGHRPCDCVGGRYN